MHSAQDSPFYRVSVKALIFDDKRRLLVFQDTEGLYEMPGGGWEHGETLEECISRELYEEMRIEPRVIGPLQFVYSGPHEKGYQKLCLAVPVTVASHQFVPSDDDLAAARFVGRDEFAGLPFQFNEKHILDCLDRIWPKVDKNRVNR